MSSAAHCGDDGDVGDDVSGDSYSQLLGGPVTGFDHSYNSTTAGVRWRVRQQPGVNLGTFRHPGSDVVSAADLPVLSQTGRGGSPEPELGYGRTGLPDPDDDMVQPVTGEDGDDPSVDDMDRPPGDEIDEDDDESFLNRVLLRNVISAEEQVSVDLDDKVEDVHVVISRAGTTSRAPRRSKSSRRCPSDVTASPPPPVRERVIHICDFDGCGRSFRRHREFVDHCRTHTGVRPFVCDVCGKAFVRSYAVTEHRRVHSGERPYQCDACGRRFTVAGDLNKHKRRLHAGQVLYKCRLCGKEMNTGRENADHRRMHEGGIFCPHCGKSFTRLHNMKEHVRVAHTGDKNYNCRDCGKQFAYARNLRYHRRLHKTERPFKCEICSRSFSTNGELTRHSRTSHNHNDVHIVYIASLQANMNAALQPPDNFSSRTGRSAVIQPSISATIQPPGISTINSTELSAVSSTALQPKFNVINSTSLPPLVGDVSCVNICLNALPSTAI